LCRAEFQAKLFHVKHFESLVGTSRFNTANITSGIGMAKENPNDAWQRAASFAARHHLHQVRRDGKTPYASHPFRVALTLRHVFEIADPVALTAALLHDVIEDTTVDYDDLAEEFGTEVAAIVAALSKDARMPEPERERAYDEQLSRADWRAKAIKLADVYDNHCDASAETKKTFVDKVRRAIAIAGDEPQLRTAVAIVTDLIA